ncbi:MAG: DEAD/DEAH box helicase family protein, partial [Stenotrophomonas sp.]|nr:DEAD/DEAH box helicase family protein [Stenotrophomonas sp.]
MDAPLPTLRIALPVPLPQLFDYLPPDGAAPEAVVGCRIRVPFGPRELVGLVVEQGSADPASSLRQALDWLDPAPLLQGELWQSLQWLARYTHAPLGEVLSTALPGPLRHGEPLPDTHHWGWQLTAAGHEQRGSLRAGSRPRQLAELLAEAVVDEDVIAARMDDWRTPARSLAKRGLAERVALAVAPLLASPLGGPTLNPEQATAVQAITAAQGFAPFLLDGVTGSGKTEVYLRAIERILRRSPTAQALLLVPEIALTPQFVRLLCARFPEWPPAVLHSAVPEAQRCAAWVAAHEGRARLIVGTRMAVWASM